MSFYESKSKDELACKNCGQLPDSHSRGNKVVGGALVCVYSTESIDAKREIIEGFGQLDAFSQLQMDAAEDRALTVGYRNYQGTLAVRRITPLGLWRGTSPFHKEDGAQWFLRAYDYDRKGARDFALKDFISTPASSPKRCGLLRRGSQGNEPCVLPQGHGHDPAKRDHQSASGRTWPEGQSMYPGRRDVCNEQHPTLTTLLCSLEPHGADKPHKSGLVSWLDGEHIAAIKAATPFPEQNEPAQISTLAKALDMLKHLEWSGVALEPEGPRACCAICRAVGAKTEGKHDTVCALRSLINHLEKIKAGVLSTFHIRADISSEELERLKASWGQMKTSQAAEPFMISAAELEAHPKLDLGMELSRLELKDGDLLKVAVSRNIGAQLPRIHRELQDRMLALGKKVGVLVHTSDVEIERLSPADQDRMMDRLLAMRSVEAAKPQPGQQRWWVPQVRISGNPLGLDAQIDTTPCPNCQFRVSTALNRIMEDGPAFTARVHAKAGELFQQALTHQCLPATNSGE